MSSYDEYQKNAAKIGKEPGKLNNDDITFMASQSKDYFKSYAEYEMFNEADKGSNGGNSDSSEGCYIATCVYGSYDCPEVWTLRRFRDLFLRKHMLGRGFVYAYYKISPHLVNYFGKSEWFRSFWRKHLTLLVNKLQEDGFENTPYRDR